MFLSQLRRRFAPHWTDEWPKVVAKSSTKSTLHIGSGFSPIPGATTVDLNTLANPDVSWDLNKFPWPFADSSYETVIAISIVEHLDDFLGVMGQIHRILKPGGEVYILVPHFSSGAAYVDPTHRQYLSARSCDYFIAGEQLEKNYGFYVPWRFYQVSRIIQLTPAWRFVPGASWLSRFKTAFWEDNLCYLIRGEGIFWHLKVSP